MTDDRLITVAIHTYDKAVALKALLEREGVGAVLHNVNLSTPVVSSGVRVRIRESDLPRALRIIENAEIFTAAANQDPDAGKTIIVPTDFSDYSKRAVKVAFDIAANHKARILLLHSFINPAISRGVPLTDSFSFELAESQELERKLVHDARMMMQEFEESLRKAIKSGELPPVKFSSEIAEGVPEDVINETAKRVLPILIVMGTRGAGRKEEELIGSVTAEMLDSCRFPVFTIPESVDLAKVTDISNVIFFSNLEQEDFLAMESLSRLLIDTVATVTIVHIPGKKERGDSNRRAAENLLEYCKVHYPGLKFKIESLNLENVVADFKTIAGQHPVNLIVIPNKKRNVFYRFFNPSLAHKLLLHADIPMIVVPV